MNEYRQEPGVIIDFSGTAPTTRTDGTPFDAATELSTYRRYFVLPDGGVESVDVDLEADGTFTAEVEASVISQGVYTTTFTSVDNEGREGPHSEEVQFKVLGPLAPPNPPTGIAPL